MVAERPGAALVKTQPPAVQLRDCIDEAEAQSVAGGVAAAFEPREALGDARQIRLRNAGAVVDHRDDRRSRRRHERQANHRSDRGVPLCIFEQVDAAPARAARGRRRRRRRARSTTAGCGRRPRPMEHSFRRARSRARSRSTAVEVAPGLAALDFGDAQDRARTATAPRRSGEARLRARLPPRRQSNLEHALLQPRPQPRQRRSQVVGDVARHLPQILEQALDPVEHAVERDRDLVEFVARAGRPACAAGCRRR